NSIIESVIDPLTYVEVLKATMIIISSIIVVAIIGLIFKLIASLIKSTILHQKLKKLLLNNEFFFIVDSENKKKIIVTFNKDGYLGKGQNEFIHRWRFNFNSITKSVLMIFQKDGRLYGRFVYYRDDRVFGLLNDIEVPAHKGQYFERKYITFDVPGDEAAG
ncbi:MAG: hypothetical protein WCR55_03300, partial [Lentisphaerota bacterium]